MSKLQQLMSQFKTPIRYEKFNGRDYVVVPMVILQEGVHKGSGGSLFYPKSEISKFPQSWNHKPVVVYHPTRNGASISACDAAVLETSGLGMLLNARYRRGRWQTVNGKRSYIPGKLVAEGWLEAERLEKVDDRVLTALERNQLMEVSTGLFTENESKRGLWHGEKYSAIARNHRPDHLAILPDKKGACSCKDGCGMPRTNQRKERAMPRKKKSERDQMIDHLIENGDWDEDDRDALENLNDDRIETLAENAGYGMDDEDEEEMMKKKKKKKKMMKNGKKPVRKKKVVNEDDEEEDEEDEEDEDEEDDEEEDEPEDNEKKSSKKKAVKNGKKPVKKTKEVVNEDEEEDDEEEEEGDEVPAELESLMEKNPQFREFMQESMTALNEQKKDLIDVIVKNASNTFSRKVLKGKPLDELKAIAALAATSSKSKKKPRSMASYVGAAGASFNEGEDDEEEEPLLPPTFNWEKKPIYKGEEDDTEE